MSNNQTSVEPTCRITCYDVNGVCPFADVTLDFFGHFKLINCRLKKAIELRYSATSNLLEATV